MNHPNEKNTMNGQNMFTNKYLQKMVISMKKTKVLYCDGDS